MTTLCKSLVAMAPGIGAAPGLIGAIILAPASCGVALHELAITYPSAGTWLSIISAFAVLVWIGWNLLLFRSKKWRENVSTRTFVNRLVFVGSALGGFGIGLILSLSAYAVVAGVEEDCEYVVLPVLLFFALIAIVLLFVAYLLGEVTFELMKGS